MERGQARIQIPQGASQLVRLGIQNDLAAVYLGDWVARFRAALPKPPSTSSRIIPTRCAPTS
jgi:hypothetical protein